MFLKISAMQYPDPKPGLLPKNGTEGCFPFQVVGIDYADLIYCWLKLKAESKAYMILFSCSVSRAVYLDLVPNLTGTELQQD